MLTTRPPKPSIIMTKEVLVSQEGPCFVEFACYQVWKLFRIQTHAEGIKATVYWNGPPAAVQTDNASEELAAFLVLSVWCSNTNDSILTLQKLRSTYIIHYIQSLSSYRAINTLHISYKTSKLTLYREIIAVCSQIHTKHINTLCGQKKERFNAKPGGIYSDHSAVHIVTTVWYIQ